MNIFGGMKILWMFLGLSQNWTIYGSFLCFLGPKLNLRVQNGGISLGC